MTLEDFQIFKFLLGMVVFDSVLIILYFTIFPPKKKDKSKEIKGIRAWLIRKLGGYTETHMLINKDGIYMGTSETGLKYGFLEGDKHENNK